MTFHNRMIDRLVTIGSCLINPALILIDHGHFQYNSISLGLAVSLALCVAQLADLFCNSSFLRVLHRLLAWLRP